MNDIVVIFMQRREGGVYDPRTCLKKEKNGV